MHNFMNNKGPKGDLGRVQSLGAETEAPGEGWSWVLGQNCVRRAIKIPQIYLLGKWVT
jgi:hypothetical protein